MTKQSDFNQPNSAGGERLLWDGSYNIRELGGISLGNGKTTASGIFLRADNLIRLTELGRSQLVKHGVAAIIDLRSPYELDMAPPHFRPMSGQPGLPTYYHRSFIDDDQVDVVKVLDQMHSLPDAYRLMLSNFSANVGAVMNTVAESAGNGPVLFHCHSGRDRTGIVAAFLLHLAGVGKVEIANDYAISSVYIQPTYSRQLTKQPEIMLGMFEFLETEYGDIRTYLQQAGVSADNLNKLASLLIP